jgi:ABC-type multidrug transport system ATPase subunit
VFPALNRVRFCFFFSFLAGRKTVGRITGDILVNGQPKQTESFARLTGYVEQMDIHIGTATVREALQFSAKLRLPTSVSDDAREKFVEEVMALVGLSSIANRLIGTWRCRVSRRDN